MSDLSMGTHSLTVTYTGDELYPEKKFNFTFDAAGKVSYPHDDFTVGSDGYISMILPDDAEGSLELSISLQDDWDSVPGVSETISFVNGVVRYSLSDLPVGSYEVNAKYTGSDYSVADDTFYIEIKNEFPDGSYALGENIPLKYVSEY